MKTLLRLDRSRIHHWVISACLLGMTPLLGQTPKSEPKPPPKPAMVDTRWPGISVTVRQIARLPGNRVAVKFTFRAAPNAPLETYIADREIKGFSGGSDEPNPAGDQFASYTIGESGKLIDQSTGKTYPTSESKPGDGVDPGRTDVLRLVRPNEGFILGAIFECPPLNQEDPPKLQWVSFDFPDLKKPITGVLLPRDENVILDFYPRRRTVSAPSSEGENLSSPSP